MRTTLSINGKRVSKKNVEALIGSDRLKRYIKESKDEFRNDPYTCLEYWLGGQDRLHIEFA